MPYIPPQRKYDKSIKLLRAYEITPVRFMAITGCSHPTAKKKIDNPGLLTTEEWNKISKRGHIPVEEIRGVFLS